MAWRCSSESNIRFRRKENKGIKIKTLFFVLIVQKTKEKSNLQKTALTNCGAN